MSIKKPSPEELLEQIETLTQQLEEANSEKADLEILLETITEHATNLENKIYAQNKAMSSYIQQVEKVTAAAAAVENNRFSPESLDEVVVRSDELGRLARVFCQMVQNLVAREKELAEAKEQLEAVLDAVPGSISWLDDSGFYVGVNRHLAENWNLSQDAFIGKEVGFLKGSSQLAKFMRQFLASPENSASQVVEVDVNESKRYYLVAARKYLEGKATVSVGIDLERQLKRALLLEQITQDIRQSLDIQQIFQTTVNQLGKIFGADRCQIFNYRIDPVAKTCVVAEFLIPAYSSMLGVEVNVQDTPCLTKAFSQERAIAYFNVNEEPALACAVPIYKQFGIQSLMAVRTSYQGQPNGAIVLHQCSRLRQWTQEEIELLESVAAQVGIAIAQAKLLQQEKQQRQALEEAKRSAEVANYAKSEFLANMSHELRTPLNAILGFAQLMERDASLSQKQRESLAIINRSGEHLLNLINDVLEMSKIEAGRTVLSPAPFDLWGLLQTLQEMFQIRANTKQLSLQFDIAPSVPQYIVSDEGKLRQVLINLLSNAIKFTYRGEVKLRVKGNLEAASYQKAGNLKKVFHPWAVPPVSPVGDPFPPLESKENRRPTPIIIEFEVEDTGIGIASEDVERLFEPFVQATTDNQSESGTGLGLAISRQFIRLMDGEIAVTSTLGQGSTFSFTIKALLADSSEVEERFIKQRVLKVAPDQPIYRILIVDDKLENRDLLDKLLASVGFETRTAINGRDAIAIWQQWQPHLIWMDMRMPVMDGYEATKQIKAHPQGKKTIILALTATAFEEQRANILAVGCDDFIRKPFQEQIIFSKMAEHLGVEYLYEQHTQITTSVQQAVPVISLTAQDLKVMPPQWLATLHQKAVEVDAESILQLIQEIPPQYVAVAEKLTTLIQQFCFDEIIDLTESNDYASS